MSFPEVPDLADLLSLNFKDLQDASPELRDRELGQIPDFFANVGSELLIREDAGQPGTLIHQLSARRIDDVLNHTAALQETSPESNVADWSLSQCIYAWANSDTGAAIPHQTTETTAATIPATQKAATPFTIHPSTVISLDAPPPTAHTADLPPPSFTPALFPHLNFPGAASPSTALGNFQYPFHLHLQQQQQQQQEQEQQPYTSTLSLPVAPPRVLASEQGGPISEAVRKQAATAARASRAAKRKEEKKKEQERERERKQSNKSAPANEKTIKSSAAVKLVVPVEESAPAAPPAAAAAASKKRKTSIGGAVTTTTIVSAGENIDKSELRAIKNRQSAAKSRAKRIEYTSTLETQVKSLLDQNKTLRSRVIAVALPPPDPHAGKLNGKPLRRTRTMPL